MKLWIGSLPLDGQVSLPRGQPDGRRLLLGGVGDVVVLVAAATLEGVVQAQPVTDLVGQGVTLGEGP